jgi:hypothetical protein
MKLKTMLIAVIVLLAGCGGDGGYRDAERCRPVPGNLAGLPDKEKCPEAYRGRAPDPNVPSVPGPPQSEPPQPTPPLPPQGPDVCATPQQRTPCVPDCRTTGSC